MAMSEDYVTGETLDFLLDFLDDDVLDEEFLTENVVDVGQVI